MTSGGRSAAVRAVPERFGWTLGVLLVAAALFGLVGVVTLVGQVGQLIAWAQPHARVPIVMSTSYELPTNGGTNEYGGGPFVRDGTAVLATQVSTILDDVPLGNRLAMGISPLLWTITALLVTAFLAAAIRRLATGASFGADTSRPVVCAAIALAVGGSLAQIVQGVSTIAFGTFAWAAPAGTDNTLTRTDGFTFEFTPLFIACGLLAIALVLRRGLALQRDVDGLV